jgi:hypothetical protein
LEKKKLNKQNCKSPETKNIVNTFFLLDLFSVTCLEIARQVTAEDNIKSETNSKEKKRERRGEKEKIVCYFII